MFKIGDTVPAGYIVKVDSWENDADDSASVVTTGLTYEDAMFFQLVASRLAHGTPYVNESMDCDLYYLLEGLLLKHPEYTEQFKKFVGISKILPEEFMPGPALLDDVREKLQEFFTAQPVNYDCDHIRVVEDIEVFRNDTPITIEGPSLEQISYTHFDWRNPAC